MSGRTTSGRFVAIDDGLWTDVDASEMDTMYAMTHANAYPEAIIDRICSFILSGKILITTKAGGVLDGIDDEFASRIFGAEMGRAFFWWQYLFGFVPVVASVEHGEVVPRIPPYGTHRFQIRYDCRTRRTTMRAIYQGTPATAGNQRHGPGEVDGGVLVLFGTRHPHIATGGLHSPFAGCLGAFNSFMTNRRMASMANGYNCLRPFAVEVVPSVAAARAFDPPMLDKRYAVVHDAANATAARARVEAHMAHVSMFVDRAAAAARGKAGHDWRVPDVVSSALMLKRALPMPTDTKLVPVPAASFDGDLEVCQRLYEDALVVSSGFPVSLFRDPLRSGSGSRMVNEQVRTAIAMHKMLYVDFVRRVFLETYSSRMLLGRILRAAATDAELLAADGEFLSDLYEDLCCDASDADEGLLADRSHKARPTASAARQRAAGGDDGSSDAAETRKKHGRAPKRAATRDAVEYTSSDESDADSVPWKTHTLEGLRGALARIPVGNSKCTEACARLVARDFDVVLPTMLHTEEFMEMLNDGMCDWKAAVPHLARTYGLAEDAFVKDWLPESERLATLAHENSMAMKRFEAKEARAAAATAVAADAAAVEASGSSAGGVASATTKQPAAASAAAAAAAGGGKGKAASTTTGAKKRRAASDGKEDGDDDDDDDDDEDDDAPTTKKKKAHAAKRSRTTE